MARRFDSVGFDLTYRNPNSTHVQGDDLWACGWAGEGMLVLASYLYYLHSHGVRGAVLECGVFKGGSTCCLSWVCDYLGLKLIAADSFCGLPDSDNAYYRKGDFSGGLDEVTRNVTRLGRIESVEFVRGWYTDSLKGLDEPLMMIWLDVDLYSSVIDALTHAFPLLVPDGVIFSDGLGQYRNFANGRLQRDSGECGGIIDYFAAQGVDHKAIFTSYGHLGLIVPHCVGDETLLFEPNKLRLLLYPTPADRVVKFVRRAARKAKRVALSRVLSQHATPREHKKH